MQLASTSRTRLMVFYLWPLRFRAILLTALLLGATGLQLVSPQIVRNFLDTAERHGALRTLIILAAFYIAAALAGQVLNVAATYTGEWVGWKATNAMRADLAEHCLSLDMSFHNNRTPGEMIERIDGDIDTLSNFFSRFVIIIMGSALYLLGVLALLWREDWRIGSSITAFAIISLLVLARLQNVSVPYITKERQASAELYGFLEERLSGIADLRSNGAAQYVMLGFFRFARNLFAAGRRAGAMEGVLWSATMAMFTLGLALSLTVGLVLYRQNAITVGTVYLIWNYTSQLRTPIQQLSQQLQDLQKATAGIKRVQQLYSEKTSITDGEGVRLSPEGPLSVEFQHVSFGYQADDPVLHDVSYELQPGEVLGLLGHTGSGKSTISKLLFRFYDVDSGRILLSNHDVRDFHLSDLHNEVGLVTQQVQIVQGTVRDNLTMYDPTIPEDQIAQALDDVGLTAWVRQLPDGLGTELSAHGMGLSAGEEQLLAFARVFLHEPRVVILDEASSRLDPATETRMEHAMDKLLDGRTAIIIAHRLSTVRRADRILVLDDGNVVEFGRREELAADPSSRFYALLRTGQEVLV